MKQEVKRSTQKKNQEERRAIDAIINARKGCALVAAAYVLETALPQLPELALGISLSQTIWCWVFVFRFRSALKAVGTFLPPLDGKMRLKPQQLDGKSRPKPLWFRFKSLLRSLFILVMMIATAVFVGICVHTFYLYVHSDICPHNPEPRPEQCDRYSGLLSHLDAHTRGFYHILKAFPGDPQTAQSMKAETVWHAQTLKKYNLFQEVDIPLAEEAQIFVFDNIVNAFSSWFKWSYVKASLQFLSGWVSPHFFPADDIFVPWPSPLEGIEALKFAGGEAIENIALSNAASGAAAINVTSDEAIEYLATAGLAAHHLRACSERCERDAAFLVDYTIFSRAPVRIGYEGYGAIAYFNSAMKLTHINCSHCGGANMSLIVAPGDELWQHAKWVFRVTMLVTCTIKDHLVGVHLMCVPLQQRVASFDSLNVRYSNYMSVALREELPLAHPMRPLIFIHTYGTTTVNRAAVFSLCVEHGLLHRASSLTWPGTEAAFKLSFEIKNRRFADMRDITTEAGTLGLNEQVRQQPRYLHGATAA